MGGAAGGDFHFAHLLADALLPRQSELVELLELAGEEEFTQRGYAELLAGLLARQHKARQREVEPPRGTVTGAHGWPQHVAAGA